MNHHHNSLLEGSVAQNVRRLSMPLVWGLLAVSLFNVIDAMYVSALGTAELAALGFTIPVVMFFMGIIFGLSVGTASVLSRAYGEGDFEKLRRLATDSLFMAAMVSVCAAIGGYFLIDHIFRAMGAGDEILPLIHHYMALWYCAMVPMTIVIVGNACIRATGDTRFASAMLMLTAILNITLDPFLIFGWGPFSPMGLAGAAMTLVVSYAVTCSVLLYAMGFRKRILCGSLFHEGLLQSWKRVLYVGIPAMAGNLVSPLSAAIVTWIIADMGKEAVAAIGVATRIEGVCFMIVYALGGGVAVFTGQNFGAGNFGRVREGIDVAAKYSLLWGIFSAAVFWIFSGQIPLLFDDHPQVIHYVSEYLRIVPISFGAMSVMIIANAALNAMGKPLPSIMLILLRTVVLYVPLSYFAAKYYGFTGVLLALTITNLIVGLVAYVLNKKVVP